MGKIKTKRAYLDAEPADGIRVLCDRLWPRGRTKDKMALTEWARGISPSDEIRKRYHGGEIDFANFRKLYEDELDKNEETDAFIERVREYLKAGDVTLVYSSKLTEDNNADVLRGYIESILSRTDIRNMEFR